MQQWATARRARWTTTTSQPKGDYRPSASLALESIYPVMEGYKDSVAFGGHAPFQRSDGLRLADAHRELQPRRLSLRVQGAVHARRQYRHALWTAGARWNAGDFYDLFGPTKRSREGYSAYVSYERPLIYNPPETLSLTATLPTSATSIRCRLPEHPSPTDKLVEAQLGFEYKYPRASIGKVDDETGHLWSVLAHVYDADGEVFPSLFGKFDVGLPLPLRHSSIWLRSGAGISVGRPRQPARQRLLRRLPQQLRRQWRRQALSRDAHACPASRSMH